MGGGEEEGRQGNNGEGEGQELHSQILCPEPWMAERRKRATLSSQACCNCASPPDGYGWLSRNILPFALKSVFPDVHLGLLVYLACLARVLLLVSLGFYIYCVASLFCSWRFIHFLSSQILHFSFSMYRHVVWSADGIDNLGLAGRCVLLLCLASCLLPRFLFTMVTLRSMGSKDRRVFYSRS